MEYIVKCSFCGETYFVNSNGSNAKFSCGACGAVNSAKAQYNLGNSYYKGEGVKKDEAIAVQWYMKAAQQGHAKAAAQGHEKAQAKLIECNNIM